MSDRSFMEQAIEQAESAAASGEVPIGAVIVYEGQVLAAYGNLTRTRNDPTAHAEILCIRDAAQQSGVQRIPDCELYVTLEPCTMCAAAISFARIKKLVIGADDPKGGAVQSGVKFFEQPTCHHRKIEIITGFMADESVALLKSFFADKR